MERTALVSLLVLLVVAAADAQSSEGDACELNDSREGVCRSISNCPETREAVVKGENPVICSYKDYIPVVCCPNSRVASRMCTKYGEAVFVHVNTSTQVTKVDTCAMKRVRRIVGGETAMVNEFPHMARLGFGNSSSDPQFKCAGVLISNRYVVTVAHCITTHIGKPTIVRLGVLDDRNTTGRKVSKDYEVSESFPHPNYKNGVFYDDIGLLKLDRDVEFTASIRPACLHTVKEIEDSDGIATGWGTTESGKSSEKLLNVKLPFIKTEVCQEAYRTLLTASSKGILDESMLCAGGEGGKDTCNGDTGGPLQIKLESPYCMYSVVGITSFGPRQCGSDKIPTIYTRVSHYVPWIESIVWANEK